MITSTLAQLPSYDVLGPNFKKAIGYVLHTDLSTLEPGRYPIDGDEVFVIINEYTTKPLAECDPESHREYADLQLMIAGREKFGYAPLDGQVPSTAYDPEKEVAFYTIPDDGLSYITIGPGEFIVFFPYDIHRPEIFADQPALVKKAVVKVAV